ncbi:hypothetical protein JW906_06800 [bacterium]|nr:hypothetical protein [bacterium]
MWSLFITAACYAFFLKNVGPDLVFQYQQPVFFWGGGFFRFLALQPGGLLAYAAAFASQALFFPVIGAAVLTLILTCGSFLSLRVLCGRTSGTVRDLFFAGALAVLFLIYCQYSHTLSAGLGYMLQLALFLIYVRSGRFAVYVPLAFLSYVLSGACHFYFALLCVIHTFLGSSGKLRAETGGVSVISHDQVIRDGRTAPLRVGGDAPATRFIRGLLCAATAFGIAYLGSRIYRVSPAEAFICPLLTLPAGGSVSLWHAGYVILPVFMVLSGILRFKSASPNAREGNHRLLAASTLGIACSMLAVLCTGETEMKKILKIEVAGRERRWDNILSTAKTMKEPHIRTAWQVNRALYHLGRLPGEMFSFEQAFGTSSLVFSQALSFRMPFQRRDIFLDLGHVNEAQHWAHEETAPIGDHPENLRVLALVNLAKGQYRTAARFLNNLNQTILYRKWAQRCALHLREGKWEDPGGVIARITGQMPSSDFIVNLEYPERDLERILESNPKNKMAFEYLMAHYLLTCRLGRLVQNICRLNDLSYEGIPKHYEEALLVYCEQSGKSQSRFCGRDISDKTRKRFAEFRSVIRKYGGDGYAAESELREKFAGTYWLYSMFENPFAAGNP